MLGCPEHPFHNLFEVLLIERCQKLSFAKQFCLLCKAMIKEKILFKKTPPRSSGPGH